MRTDSKVVLYHLPGNTGDVGGLSRKHINSRPQESDELAYLFVVEGGAYGESSTIPSSLMGTFLVSGGVALDFLLLPAELSGMSSTGAQHPEEVRLPEWVRGVSPVFFPLWPWSLSLLCLSCAFGFSPASLSCLVMRGRGGWL